MRTSEIASGVAQISDTASTGQENVSESTIRSDFSKLIEITGNPERITKVTVEITNDELPIPETSTRKKQSSEYPAYPKRVTSVRNSPDRMFPRIGTSAAEPRTTAILGSPEKVASETTTTGIDQSAIPIPVPTLAETTERSTRIGFTVTKFRMLSCSAGNFSENSCT